MAHPTCLNSVPKKEAASPQLPAELHLQLQEWPLHSDMLKERTLGNLEATKVQARDVAEPNSIDAIYLP